MTLEEGCVCVANGVKSYGEMGSAERMKPSKQRAKKSPSPNIQAREVPGTSRWENEFAVSNFTFSPKVKIPISSTPRNILLKVNCRHPSMRRDSLTPPRR